MHTLAYIDPGAGALIWQSFVGACVGGIFCLRQTRKWIGGLVGKVIRHGQTPVNPTVDPSRSEIDGKMHHREWPKQE